MNATHFTRTDSLADDFVRPSGTKAYSATFNRYQIFLKKLWKTARTDIVVFERKLVVPKIEQRHRAE